MAPTRRRRPTSRRRTWLAALGIVLGVFMLGLGLAAALISIGVYDIAARQPHTRPIWFLLDTVQRNAVEFHAGAVEQRVRLDDPALIRRGLRGYREHCVTCHGAPGETRSRIGVGLNPNPPPLVDAARRWTAPQLYWIISNGLKMAGMPAFGLGETRDELWAITAFVVRMQTLSPADYRALVAALEAEAAGTGDAADPAIAWVERRDLGWAALARRGDADRGRARVRELGCGSCHMVPEVAGARGLVGPPLRGWSRRHYVAGRLVNVPTELVRWIQDPPSVDPATAMPRLGVSEQDAWDLAAFLYELR